MTKSNTTGISITLLVCVLLCGVFATTKAAPLPANGYNIRLGAGFSPYARTDLLNGLTGKTDDGPTASVLLGYVWNHVHSIEFRWQNVFLGETSQGVLGFSYTRYLAKKGPAPFFSIGFGIQRGPFLGANFSGVPTIQSAIQTDGGAAVLFGAGLRFSKRVEVALDYSFGSSNRFFDSNNFFDFRHKQLAFSLRYVLWGE